MLYRLSIAVHLVNVDSGDSGILWIVVEQIQKINMGPNIVTNG